jgi:hypothetical protein
MAGRWIEAKVLGGPRRIEGDQSLWIDDQTIRWTALAPAMA